MTVEDTIAVAESLLPGQAAPEGELDLRWQAILDIEPYVSTHPSDVWRFVARWGVNEDEDLRDAIATCLLEHLLEEHFSEFFPKVEAMTKASKLFADTFTRCWKFGQAAQPGNAERFDQLKQQCQAIAG